MSTESVRSYFNSPRGHHMIRFLVLLVLAFLIFHVGYTFGSHNMLSRERVLIMRGPGALSAMPTRFAIGGHGVIGSVTAIASSTMEIQTKDGATQQVAITPETEITAYNSPTSTAIAKGAFVIVIGTPEENGGITADLIRVLPTSTALHS